MANEATNNPYKKQIADAAAKYGIDESYLTNIIKIESNFDPNAKSPTGPRGLGQFTKATGAKYGLKTDSDFFDPTKSINAAANHISDLLKTNNNDYVRTSLAYNQGMGLAGQVQLDAYDRGDYSMISSEGQKYIKNNRDWDSGSNQGLTTFLASGQQIQSKYVAPTGSQPTGSTTLEGGSKSDVLTNANNMPQPTMFDVNAGETVSIPQVGNNYEVDMFNQTGKTVQEVDDPTLWQSIGNAFDTTSDYAEKAVIPGIYRAVSHSPGGTIDYLTDRIRTPGFNTYTPDDSDYQYAREQGVASFNYNMLEGADSKEGWKFAVDQAIKTQKATQRIDDSNSTTGHVIGFATDILLDPTSYIPLIGPEMKGLKLGNAAMVRGAQGATWGVSSAAAHNTFSGDNSDYLTATIFGAALGGGLGIVENKIVNRGANTLAKSGKSGQEDAAQVISDKITDDMYATSQRIESRESAATLDAERMDLLPPDPNTPPAYVSENGNSFWDHPFDKDAVVMADGSVIDGGNILNPKTILKNEALANGKLYDEGATKVASNVASDVKPVSDVSPIATTESGDIVENAVNGLDANGNAVNAAPVETPTLTPEVNQGNSVVDSLSTKTDTPKAATLNLGGFTEIGNAMLSSADNFVRNLGSKLFRPSVDKNGSRGAFDTTSSDIIQRLKGTDNLWNSKYTDLESKALDDVKYKDMPKSQRLETLNRNVVEALEDTSGVKLANLSEAERNMVEHVRSNFVYKEDLAVNPHQLGSIDAIPLMNDKTFTSGNYAPRHYNPSKIMDLKQKLTDMGIAAENVATVAKDLVKQSFTKAYLKNALQRAELDSRILKKIYGKKTARLNRPIEDDFATKAEFDVAMKDYVDQSTALKAGVDEYIEKLSYGIVNGGEDSIGAITGNLFGHGDGAVTKQGANFLKERSPLSTDEVVALPDGSTFSVNDVRDFSLRQIIPSYNTTISHKLAVHGVGFTEDTLRTTVNENAARLRAAGDKRGAEALEQGYKVITGQQRRSTMENVRHNLMAAVQTAVFGTRNTYFGAMTVTEINNMLLQGSWRAMLDNIPILRDIFAYNTKAGRQTLQELHDFTFGSYLDDSIRPTYRNRVAAINANPNATVNQFAVKGAALARTGADALAHYNPFTYILRETTNGVINTARKTLISDIVRNVFDGGNMPRYLRNEAKLNGLSVSPKQMDEIRDLIKDHITFNGKGDYTLKDAQKWVADPRTATLFRLADNYADKIILRPETISSAQTKLFPRTLNMITQFKMFSVRSINGRMMQMYGDTRYNGQLMDNAMELALSAFTAGIGYAGQTYGMSKTMPEEQRDKYLSQAFEDTNLLWNIASRSAVVGGPIGLASTAYTIATGNGPGKFLRSTVTPSLNDKQDNSVFKGQFNQSPTFTGAAGRFVQQMPALNYAANLAAAPYYTAKMLASDEYAFEHTDYATAAYNNWRGVLPNNPLSFLFLDQIFRTQGIDSNYLRK